MNSDERRITGILINNGAIYTANWAKNTMRIYRKDVLDKDHFASKGEFRRKFIQSYLFHKNYRKSLEINSSGLDRS